ncbi:MAG: tetratricopeptide repeat protein [Deltaproteobacteria bacterium]|nr:tetratricopeptide repeat protein [Deltaproteobacteria bacterium]
MSIIDKALRQLEVDRKGLDIAAGARSFLISETTLSFKKKFFVGVIASVALGVAVMTVVFMGSGNKVVSTNQPVPKVVSVMIAKPGAERASLVRHEREALQADASLKTQPAAEPNELSQPPAVTDPVDAADQAFSRSDRNYDPFVTSPEAGAQKPDTAPAGKGAGAARSIGSLAEGSVQLRPAETVSVDELINAGVVLMEQGAYGDARAKYNEALRYAPQHDRALNNMGVSYYHEGDLEKAIDYYRKALAFNQYNFETYGNLGIAYVRTRRFNLAEDMYRQALLLSPAHAEILYNYGLMLMRAGRSADAKTVLQRFVEVAPPDMAALTHKVRKRIALLK